MDTSIKYLKYNIGEHLSFSKSISNVVKTAIDRGLYSCQMFMGNPKTCNRQRIQTDDIEITQQLNRRFPVNIFTHFPYVANLNGSVANLAWNGNHEQDTKTNHMLGELQYELSVVSNFHTDRTNTGVVIHPGCYPDIDIGLDTIAKSINYIDFSDNSKLILENCAGEGRKLCKNFQEIKRVFDGVDVSKKDNVGVCVDSCHVHGSGIYDLRKRDGVDRMFHDFDNILGIDKFTLLHLNDSIVPFGSKKDRHACLGDGTIWGESLVSLEYLLEKCKQNNVPIVLETPDAYRDLITVSNF